MLDKGTSDRVWKRKPLGRRALAPCVTYPHPETDRPTHVLVVKTGIEVLRQKSKVETKKLGPLEERSLRLARPSPGKHAMRRR